ncbi:hypothetical protein PC41400_19180 [Paenibacillus chitinolyticus]|uniref:Uncharacterized protein n=1 Tax=Paenibacillus chitinolyticus TaxID=79263 RepID=A0A410WZB1_9BACL|nr:hypothetical protein [Paenibacillus chitinolyticus]MCY9590337.1 hypothetical protein [Paenibacillus chitinolyticus]MCY9597033.1 hypothetical protein [Paenibacillus chitinolyticus]QAV19673.1 hypothetical protein PC41400_19180 [Paenibacillus chitinolyticus]
MKKIVLIVFFICIFALSFYYYSLNGDKMNSKVRNVMINEINVLENEHVLLSNTASFSNSTFSFAQRLRLDPNMEVKYDLRDDDYYRYYINKEEKDIISGEYTIDTIDDANEIILVAIQGNKVAPLRIKNDNKWNNSLRINFAANSTTKIPVEIKWNPNKEEDLIVFPIKKDKHGEYYSGGNLGVVRYYIQNTNSPTISKDEIHKQSVINEKLVSQEGIKPVPTLTWIGDDGNPIKLVLDKNQMMLSNTKSYSLKISATPYSTVSDLLLLNENFEIKVIKRNIQMYEGRETNLTFPPEIFNKTHENSRQFLLLLNNRGRSMLTDMMSINEMNKAFPTSFQQVIEVFPLKN